MKTTVPVGSASAFHRARALVWSLATAALIATVLPNAAVAAPDSIPSQGTLWLVARADGSAARSSGLVALTKLGTGAYEARFSQDVSGCAYTATVADPASGVVYAPGLVFAAGGHLSPDGVYVETKNIGGGLADFPFHLSVDCRDDPTAVVDASGRLVRGRDAQSVTRLGAGRYEVRFNRDVSDCAHNATVADPGRGVVFAPGLVFTAAVNLDPSRVYVETKNPGGGLADLPFHLVARCASMGQRAVVDASGRLVRGRGARLAIRGGTGRYQVIFGRNADLSGCAFSATVADPGAGLVPAPGLAFAAAGPSGGVSVETKNMGGGLTDLPFHLSVDCSRRPLRDEGISILNLNLQGMDSEFTFWRTRWERVARWMGGGRGPYRAGKQRVPDLLVFQETTVRKCFFLRGCDPLDYQAVFELMAAIEARTGVRYRVAHLSAGHPRDGLDWLFQGPAVLYNPVRLRNVTPVVGDIFPYDPGNPAFGRDPTRTAELRPSYPCREPAPASAWRCALVDTSGTWWGLHWAAAGVTFTRFALAERQDLSRTRTIDVYDEHAPFIPNTNGTPDLQLLADAGRRLEQLIPPGPGARLLPPLAAGDFNNSRQDMDTFELNPGQRLADWEIAAYVPPGTDRIGVLRGRREVFPSEFTAEVASNHWLPDEPEIPGYLCQNASLKWSDHCGQYLELLPGPR